MLKNNKIYLPILVLFFFSITISFAKEKINFLSLKNDEVNLRQGPSFKYPIKFIYKKKYLPVEILDKSDAWKKIKDYEKNTGWIHISQLSKKKSAINVNENSLIYQKPTIYSKPLVRLEIGRLVLVKKCKDEWCKVTSGNYSGWIFKSFLWGKFN